MIHIDIFKVKRYFQNLGNPWLSSMSWFLLIFTSSHFHFKAFFKVNNIVLNINSSKSLVSLIFPLCKVSAICLWWKEMGKQHFLAPTVVEHKLLFLTDSLQKTIAYYSSCKPLHKLWNHEVGRNGRSHLFQSLPSGGLCLHPCRLKFNQLTV